MKRFELAVQRRVGGFLGGGLDDAESNCCPPAVVQVNFASFSIFENSSRELGFVLNTGNIIPHIFLPSLVQWPDSRIPPFIALRMRTVVRHLHDVCLYTLDGKARMIVQNCLWSNGQVSVDRLGLGLELSFIVREQGITGYSHHITTINYA